MWQCVSRLLGSVVVGLGVVSAGCVSAGGSLGATIQDDPANLSMSGDDPLFSLTLTGSPGDAFAPSEIAIQIEHGGRTLEVTTVHVDVDENGTVGPGDRLRAVEPPLNWFDATAAGLSLPVSVVRDTGPSSQVLLVRTMWTPDPSP